MLTDDDKKLGIITYGKGWGWRAFRLVWSSGGGGDYSTAGNSITLYAFGYVFHLPVFNLIRPYREKVMATYWDADTIKRMGRDWYYNVDARDYGFSISDGFFQLFHGRQTHDSSTTETWSCFIPWTQWRMVRHSLYDDDLNEFWSWKGKCRKRIFPLMDKVDECPKVSFRFMDYDDTQITATTHIEEREWRFGEGWFKWLFLFRKNRVHRSLDIAFSEEVGPRKGSWKGGTVGHGIDIEQGETHEGAFRRYCYQGYKDRGGNVLPFTYLNRIVS